jgi:hypothetical protein
MVRKTIAGISIAVVIAVSSLVGASVASASGGYACTFKWKAGPVFLSVYGADAVKGDCDIIHRDDKNHQFPYSSQPARGRTDCLGVLKGYRVYYRVQSLDDHAIAQAFCTIIEKTAGPYFQWRQA